MPTDTRLWGRRLDSGVRLGINRSRLELELISMVLEGVPACNKNNTLASLEWTGFLGNVDRFQLRYKDTGLVVYFPQRGQYCLSTLNETQRTFCEAHLTIISHTYPVGVPEYLGL